MRSATLLSTVESVDASVRGTMEPRTETNSEHEIIIAVMGQTGSGKSRFIFEATGSEAVRVGHTLESSLYALVKDRLCIDLKSNTDGGSSLNYD